MTPPTWTPQQKIAQQMLARGRTRQAAADAAQCSLRTVQSWKTLPGFMEAVEEERTRLAESEHPEAVRVLEELLSHSDASIRLRAATALIREAPPEALPTTGITVVELSVPEHLLPGYYRRQEEAAAALADPDRPAERDPSWLEP